MKRRTLEARRRRAARIALYSGIALVAVGAAATYWLLDRPQDLAAEVGWAEVDWRREPAARLLQQYLRIDSTTVAGDEYAAALYLATPLRAAGLDVTVERLGERRANLWAILEGRTREAVVLHGHLDTEPIVDPEAWQSPPFVADIDPPWIFGRGAFDMKSYTAAQLWALLDLASRGITPERSVIFLVTSSEERGSELGMKWILREHPELADRFWGVLTEGGVVEVTSLSRPVKYWGTEFGQKRFVEVVACSEDRHRLEVLAADVRDHGLPLTGLRLLPEVRLFWDVYGPTRERSSVRDLLAEPDELLRDPVAFLGLPPYLRSMLRDEAVPFAPTESEGGGWELRIVLHLLPGTDPEAARRRLLPDWITRGVELTVRDSRVDYEVSPLDHLLFRAVQEQLGEDFPGHPAGPFFLPWTATDARYLRRAGVPAYGFSPFFIMTPDTLGIGAANERIALSGYRDGVDLYTRLLRRIAGPEDGDLRGGGG